MSGKRYPLYGERRSNDRILIKVAESPAVWINKRKWLWLETHPEELGEVGEHDVYLSLTGDPNNFDVEYIIRCSRHIYVIINQMGGFTRDIEYNKTLVALAKLKKAKLDLGEKAGLVHVCGISRSFKEKTNRYKRKYMERKNKDPEFVRKRKEYMREYNKHLTEKQKKYKSDWVKRHREETKGEADEKQCSVGI